MIPLIPGVTCRGLVHVDRVVVAHGLHPVTDHGQVHGIGPHQPGTGGEADERLQLFIERAAGLLRGGAARHRCLRRCHLDARFIPSPAVAKISRWTSLTPPPKVLICDCRPARSSSPWSAAPGESGLR